MPALPPSSAAPGPGDAAGESEAVGSGGLSAVGPDASSADGASADGSVGSSSMSPLSGDEASSEAEEEGLDEEGDAMARRSYIGGGEGEGGRRRDKHGGDGGYSGGRLAMAWRCMGLSAFAGIVVAPRARTPSGLVPASSGRA
ncbi:hypothetical protein E2562_009656, partial [Oryza meyeriana var. granulata]